MSSPVPEYIASNPSSLVPIHPFVKAAGADATLRSFDGADFYVHRTILSLPSPAESSPAVPIIDLQEGSAALDRALRLFYPGTYPNIETLDKLREVIEVLMKYDMQREVPVVKQHLEKHHSSRPLAVYAIAFRHRWKDVAVAAARESLKHALRMLLADAPPELEGVTAVAYHNLLQYHSRCGEATRSTTTSLKWFLWPATLEHCSCKKTPVIFSDNVYHKVVSYKQTLQHFSLDLACCEKDAYSRSATLTGDLVWAISRVKPSCTSILAVQMNGNDPRPPVKPVPLRAPKRTQYQKIDEFICTNGFPTLGDFLMALFQHDVRGEKDHCTSRHRQASNALGVTPAIPRRHGGYRRVEGNNNREAVVAERVKGPWEQFQTPMITNDRDHQSLVAR
ncbi:hypothetical protein B0H17DRAFT_1135535 [Mycena rosella]|uniref:BTB domain-containing protein n=1 Tax=Mycena rosella TaxID=1033263 RepID=A0AAD7GCY4_MYCRO|nr:hypothetical protein B0H17DRAFT_1135535 [Mycena rosella]